MWRMRLVSFLLLFTCLPLVVAQKKPSSGPTFVRLPELNGTYNSQVSDVNKQHVIVGTMWNNSDIGTTVAWVQPSSGGSWSPRVIAGGWAHPAGPFATGINNSNHVILRRPYGISSVWIPTDDTFTSGTEISLPTWGGRCCSSVRAINDDDLILGSVYNVSASDPSKATEDVPVIWVPNLVGTWDVFPLDDFCDEIDPDVPGLQCGFYRFAKSGGWVGGEAYRYWSKGWWGRAVRATMNTPGTFGDFVLLGGLAPMPDPPQPPLSGVYTINSSGQSAGYYKAECASSNTGLCKSEAVFWDRNGLMRILPTVKTSSFNVDSRANGINDAGDVVGLARFGKGGTTETGPAWWKYGATAPVRLAVPSGQSGEAVAINNTGLIIGHVVSGARHAAAWVLPK